MHILVDLIHLVSLQFHSQELAREDTLNGVSEVSVDNLNHAFRRLRAAKQKPTSTCTYHINPALLP